MNDGSKMVDELKAVVVSGRRQEDGAVILGWGTYELVGPDGEVKQEGLFHNLITDRGDEYYAKRGHGTSDAVVTGMRLGTGTTAPAKNGAGAAIVNYTSGSHRAFTGFTVATKGAGQGWRIQHVASWPAGVATANGIAEAVITNETPLTNVAGTAANTIARALLSPVVNKGADDTLTVTWNHDLQGS